MKKKNLFAYEQSGVQGFFGNPKLVEYSHQKTFKKVPGYSFDDMVFVAKTVTANFRQGNTDLNKDGFSIKKRKLPCSFFLILWLFIKNPQEFIIRYIFNVPDSIWVSFRSWWRGDMLNAVGLSNAGLEKTLKAGYWQQRKDYFQISIQLESNSYDEIVDEINHICSLLKRYLNPSQYKYGIQINKSCPNTGHAIKTEAEKIKAELIQFREHLPEVDFYVKFNALVSTDMLTDLQKFCKGFVISNTIPFGQSPDLIDYKKHFPKGSPLKGKLRDKNAEGGISGYLVYPVLIRCLEEIETFTSDLNIIAGGGVMRKSQVDELARLQCVKGIALGVVATLRPWRVKGLSKYINQIFSNRESNKFS